MSDPIVFKGGARALLASLAGTKVIVEGVGGAVTVTMADAMKKLAHKPAGYMPAIKAALKRDELATPAECADHLEKLRGHVEACLDDEGDPEGQFNDIDLGSYTKPLKELVDASPGDTWEEVFDAVDALIKAAIEEHEVRDHSGASMNDHAGTPVGAPQPDSAGRPPAATPAPGDTAMADAALLSDLEKKLTTAFEAKFAESALQMTAVQGKLAEQERVIAAKDAEITALKDEQKRREAEKATMRVEEAFETYKDKMLLTDAHKPQMAIYLATAPVEFEKLYPRVAGSQRHLLANLSGGRTPGAGGNVPPAVKPPSLRELSLNLARSQKLELADAQCIVYAAARRARQQIAA